MLAIVVSEEPLLPSVAADPNGKVESYLDVADAFVALCTPDDELSDGSVQTRENIIDEIQRAYQKDHLCFRIQVFKATDVRLPSNLNPTYEDLAPDDPISVVERIIRQLAAWRVITAVPARMDAPSEPRVLGLERSNRADIRVLEVLADETSSHMVQMLLDKPARQREIAVALGVPASAVSRRMAALEQAGLVTRAGPREPYVLTHPQAVRNLLVTAADLSLAIMEHEFQVNHIRAREMRKSAVLDGSEERSSVQDVH